MLTVLALLTMRTVVVVGELVEHDFMVRWTPGIDLYGPVVVQIANGGSVVWREELYGGAYGFRSTDVFYLGPVSKPTGLIVRANDAPGYFWRIWIDESGEVQSQDWSSRWRFEQERSNGEYWVSETVDIETAHRLGWGVEGLPDEGDDNFSELVIRHEMKGGVYGGSRFLVK